ncbi:MAG: hypothetical protein ABSG88_25050 [Bradyrhizobium sp.]|jgi:hypothetical protein
MFGKLSVRISVSVVAAVLGLGSNAGANTLSKVSTRIIPNWNNTRSDVCFIHNSNNVQVSAVVSVFPMGTAAFGIDSWTFPVFLDAFGSARLFSWTPPRRGGSCKVLSVQ